MNTKHCTKQQKFLALFVLAAQAAFFAPQTSAQTITETRSITFPVIGRVTYYDDFGAPRDGGARSHEGNDLMGSKMMPLVAAVDGRVRVTYPQASYGYAMTITDKDGYSYHYLHMNNDTPGTDDGNGGGSNAFAVDIDDGNTVVAGQLIGWMGDSGNAETTRAHLHFEIRRPDRTPISPYNSLQAAAKITAPVARPAQPGELLPYGEFGGGAFVAAGQAANGVITVTSPGPGGGPHIQVFDSANQPVNSFFAYAAGFRGGVAVALGDVTGDGADEIITAPNSRGGPHVKIFSATGLELGGFMAYDPKFMGGVSLASVDVDNDGKDEIVTAPGTGGGPHVRIFKPDGTEVAAFMAYDQAFRGGVNLTAGRVSNQARIATAPNRGGGPHVKVFDAAGLMQSEFMAYDPAHLGGMRLALSSSSFQGSAASIVTVPLRGGPQIKSFSLSGNPLEQGWAFEEWWSGSWDVATVSDRVYVAVGPDSRRRAAVREVSSKLR